MGRALAKPIFFLVQNQVTNPEGVLHRLGYDAAGRLTTITDADNHTTTLGYDGINRLISVTNPLGHSVSMTYDSRNNLRTFTDANGNVTQRHYDGIGNLVKQINALNQETRYVYDDENRLTQVIDAKDRVTELGYDKKGRLNSITNPLNQTQQLEYDAAGNLKKRFDALGKLVMSLNYDELNQPTSVSDALQNSSSFQYDELSRITQTIDPKDRVTKFAYDDLNRLVESIDALQGVSSQSFDADGNQNSLTDPNQNQTQFAFDLSGRLVQETLSTNDKVKYTYSARDLLESVTNGRNQARQFEYDAAGRLTSWTDPDGTVSYTYDNNGNVLTVTDATGTITREYDKLNRVTKYIDSQNNTLQYAYDEVGNLVTLTYPDDKEVHYAYNDADLLIKVTDWATRKTTYEYDPNGRLKSTTRPNGTKMLRLYDEAGQLKQQKDIVVATGEVISQFDFSYDKAGNIVEEKSSPEADPDINLEMTYQAANRLATHDSDVVQFDADGNMTKGPLSGELVDFAFDSRNRLTQAGSTTYRYDAENQRIGVNQTQYVVNSQPNLSQVLVKEENGVKTFYVYGLGLIGQETGGKYTSYHFDLRGSTIALTNESGQITERFQYSPYGVLLSGNATKTPFLFNGMYGVMSDSNGLYYMRARFYSPEMRRFVNQDILLGFVEDGQTLNRYAYVTGRPVSYVDPFGLGTYDYDSFFEEFLGPNSKLWKTQTGLQWLWELANQDLDVIVKLGTLCQDPITELMDEHGFPTSLDSQLRKPKYWLITIDPKRKLALMGAEGHFIASLIRILVHELGHGVGAEDSGGAWYEIIPWFRSDAYMMDNVLKWENPWMEELGEKIPRIRYSPVTEFCSCER